MKGKCADRKNYCPAILHALGLGDNLVVKVYCGLGNRD